MTERLGSLATATRKAIIDPDDAARHRLGEVRQNGEAFTAYDRLGNYLGDFDSADAAIAQIRRLVESKR